MSHDSRTEISVIVVNYGTPDLAISAVESVLERDHGEYSVNVHLVDNASPGDDAARFRTAHAERGWGSRVVLYCETVNHGFGRGNNVVLHDLAQRETPPDKVFFLNPDARLRIHTIERLAQFLDEHPEVGVAGCGILRPDGTPASAAFRFPSGWSEFSTAAQFGPVSRMLKRHTVALPPDLPTMQVDWVSGAAFMARFDALRTAAFFDPAFFLYYEEIDLMKRVSEQGWQIWHLADAEVVHEAGVATGVQGSKTRSGRLPAYWYDSWRTYFVNRHGRTGAALVALSRLSGWCVHMLSSALRAKRPTAPSHFMRDFSMFVLKPIVTGRFHD